MTWPAIGLLLMECVGGWAGGSVGPNAARAESGAYVPYSGIERGTLGVVPVAVEIANETGAEIVCSVALAHWYAADLGVAGPGGTIVATLWHDPETGALALLNAAQDRMPVEALWCGLAGRAHATRAVLALPFAAGPAPPPIARRCRLGPERLICEER